MFASTVQQLVRPLDSEELFTAFDVTRGGDGWQLDAGVSGDAVPTPGGPGTPELPTSVAEHHAMFVADCDERAGAVTEAAGNRVCTTPDGVSHTEVVLSQEQLDADAEATERFARQFTPEDYMVTVAFEFPGTVTSGNATKVDGNTATWDLEIGVEYQPITATSRSADSTRESPSLLVAGVLFTAVALVVALWTRRRRADAGARRLRG